MNPTFDTDFLRMLKKLNGREIYLWQEDGKLKYKCKKGEMSESILNKLKEVKQEFVEFLQYCENNMFQLSSLQSAYLIGGDNKCELGNISAHYYVEYEAKNINTEKLEKILNELIKRHDALRMVILPEGKNLILNNLPQYELTTYSYSTTLERDLVRNNWKNHDYPVGQWPMFHFEVGKSDILDDVLHISFDCLILDAWSAQELIDEIFKLYRGETVSFPKQTFKEYMNKFREYQYLLEKQADDYWNQEIKNIVVPEIKTKIPIQHVTKPSFERIDYTFSLNETVTLYDNLRRIRLTPAATICTLFMKSLCDFFMIPGITLDITLYNRLPFYKEPQKILGEFTNIGLATLKKDGSIFFDEAIDVQRQFWKLLQYREYDGTKLLKKVGQGKSGKVYFPIVYTCMLTGNSEYKVQDSFREVYALSKTPQVMLDHHVRDDLGYLKLSFDYVTDLFDEKDMIRLMDLYIKNIKELISLHTWKYYKPNK